MTAILSFFFGFCFSLFLFRKTVAAPTVNAALRWLTPLVLDRLDPLLPFLIQSKSKSELRDTCLELIYTVAEDRGKSITATDATAVLKDVVSAYSFLENAAKLYSK